MYDAAREQPAAIRMAAIRHSRDNESGIVPVGVGAAVVIARAKVVDSDLGDPRPL